MRTLQTLQNRNYYEPQALYTHEETESHHHLLLETGAYRRAHCFVYHEKRTTHSSDAEQLVLYGTTRRLPVEQQLLQSRHLAAQRVALPTHGVRVRVRVVV